MTQTVSTAQPNDVHARLRQVFLYGLIASLSIAALIGISLVLFYNFGELEIRILLTTLSMGVLSLAGLCDSAVYGRGRARPLAVTGIVLSSVTFLYSLVLIWGNDHSQGLVETMGVLIVLSVSIAHISLVLLTESADDVVKIARTATVVCIALVALILSALIYSEGDLGEGTIRLLLAIAILDVLGSILTPVLRKIRG